MKRSMEIRPIHNDNDHRTTLAEITRRMESDPAPGTPEGDRLEVLATLVEAYEARQYPIAAPPRGKPSNPYAVSFAYLK